MKGEVKVDSTEITYRNYRKTLVTDEFINPTISGIEDIQTTCTYDNNLLMECESTQGNVLFEKITFKYNSERKISEKIIHRNDSQTLVVQYNSIGLPIYAVATSNEDTVLVESAYYLKDSILINAQHLLENENQHLLIGKINDQNNFTASKSTKKKGRKVRYVIKDPTKLDKEYYITYKLDKQMNWVSKTVARNGIGTYISTLSHSKRKIHYHSD